jgi:aldehyde:ferredoxin oxidoreductase
MNTNQMMGYSLKLLRVNLTTGKSDVEEVDDATARKYVGGTGLGAKYLYEEVPPGVEWSDPENRIMFFTGPLAGTRVSGSGTISVISKGPMTNMAGASQANGFFGAFLRFSGLHGIIIQGAAKKWTRLHIHDGTAELVDAEHLIGKDTWETEDAVGAEIGSKCSVYSIGPAGENLVRFAVIVGDHGHVASKNGLGAVMGSKKLKCVSVERGKMTVPVAEPERLSQSAKALIEDAMKVDPNLSKSGTAFAFEIFYPMGALPVRNYTTNIFPEWENFKGSSIRSHFKVKPVPCWACRQTHVGTIEITEGPYKGFQGEEPEYEQLAAMGPVIDQKDPAAAIVLANLVDRLGIDNNEVGYVIAWIMECYEKGFLSKTDLDGIEMNWGDVEATMAMLKKIARRDGCGNLFAEGVKRAAEKIGGAAANCGVYTMKGASVRGHDHRGFWTELLDTCLGNTGTIETGGPLAKPGVLGLAPVQNRFDPLEVSTMNAKLNGGRQFEDCLGVCRFCTSDFNLTLECLNAITGWNFTIPEAMDVGRRTINLLRMFNYRHGLTKELEAPSVRYGSTPVDGPAKGIGIMEHWEAIRRNYYEQMGWDTETGKPLPETLQKLGLGEVIDGLRR